MRRFIAIVGAIVFAVGVAGVLPASATHCPVGAGITGCANPVTVVIVEGVGKVCSNANPADPCTYDYSDPTWVGKSVFQHWANSSQTVAKQGLYWPGVGPGAEGPYKLAINRTPGEVSPGTGPQGGNVCVSNVDGAGCGVTLAGQLTAGASGVGAHCGSSKGKGSIDFTSASGSLHNIGTLGWEQSAATILPTTGQVTKTGSFTYPANARPSIIGFSSSRGLGGSGNCGTQRTEDGGGPTIGFNVEGMTVTY